VAPGLQLGINQFVVHRDLKTPAVGWEQGKRFDLRLKLFDQLIRQADGPVSVVSNGAVGNRNVEQHVYTSNVPY
jgi:hypothetical protein